MTLLHAYFHLRNQRAFQRLLDGGSSRGHTAGAQGLSSSGGKSWSKPSPLTSGPPCDVNARDPMGRTVLHLAAAAQDAAAPEYVRLLLAHPDININLSDKESHWTALHRALYHGNLASATLLLQRAELDTSLKDLEGYTAFDLYNSTLEGTKPSSDDTSSADLFTWGANRNAALGVGNGDDRAHPELVTIRPTDTAVVSEKDSLDVRFSPIHARQIAMSKLHTAVVTSESRNNLRVCGFGSGGRLGPGQHTQYSLVPLPQFTQTVVSVALGQDHTLALTKSGEVYSWGLNRFSQLGYVVEPSAGASALGRLEEPIQATARKVTGPLKNKVVRGVAACKTASACWTSEEVFTWGTNSGQLGYDKSAHPVQVVPRVVTKVSQPVISVTITDSALACLLITQDVVCVWNDGHSKVNFPAHAFPSEIAVYRPPQATNNASIQKIISCDNTFAALSLNGELFTFSVPAPSEGGGGSGRSRATVVPQRVWALRKQFSAVKDVALGSDGSIIICTESGHVFVRSRNLKAGQTASAKTFKFQRVPYIQRAVRVCANATGAYGALRVDYKPDAINVVGNTIAQDIAAIQPYIFRAQGDLSRALAGGTVCSPRSRSPTYGSRGQGVLPNVEPDLEEDDVCFQKDVKQAQLLHTPPENDKESRKNIVERTVFAGPFSSTHHTSTTFSPPEDIEPDDEAEDVHIRRDIEQAQLLCTLLERDKEARKKTNGSGVFAGTPLIHGADLMVQVQSTFEFPAHRVILAARCGALEQVLSGGRAVQEKESNLVVKMTPVKNAPASKLSKIAFTGCQPLSVLIFIAYLYTDEVLALWDRRIGDAVAHRLAALKIKPAQVKAELQVLARIFKAPLLAEAIEPPVKRTPTPSMAPDLHRLFDTNQSECTVADMTKGVSRARDPLRPDVVLQLRDRDVLCHSVILRARSPFFAAFFDDEEWTVKRWSPEGTLTVNLKHLEWRAMGFVCGFMCCGRDSDMFETIDHVRSVDELIDFSFDVMAAANELLLDRLILLCSEVILKRITINNVCSVLTDATFFYAMPLVRSLHSYIVANMETLLESRMLDDLTPDLIRQLAVFVRQQQAQKYPVSRSSRLVDKATRLFGDWLALQDIPQPYVPTPRAGALRDLPRLSPSGPGKKNRRHSQATSPPISPTIRPQLATTANLTSIPDDGIFTMDDPDVTTLSTPVVPSDPVAVQPASKSTATWKTISAPRVDMRTIIAETSNPPQMPVPAPIPRMPSGDLNPTTRRVLPRDTGRIVPPVAGTPEKTSVLAQGSGQTPSDSPWRLPPVPSSATLLRPSPTTVSRSSGAVVGHTTGPSSPGSPHLQTNTRKAPGPPGLGPVFTPSRQVVQAKGASSSVRQVSNGRSWTLPPVRPVVQASSSGSGMSFVAIQQLQREQDVPPTKDMRSLHEIQREERERQVEEDFLRWWAAEEDRLRAEEQAAAVRPPSRPSRARKLKGPKTEAASTTATEKKQRTKPSRRHTPRGQAATGSVLDSVAHS